MFRGHYRGHRFLLNLSKILSRWDMRRPIHISSYTGTLKRGVFMKMLFAFSALSTLLLVGCGGSNAKQEVPVNNAPVINALDSLTINELTTQNLQTTVSDPDGDNVTLSWSQISGSTLTLANISDPTISITAPAVENDEDTVIRLVATDEHGSSTSKDITVTIININQLPVAVGSDDVSTVVGSEVELNGSASYDNDGEIVDYQWSVVTPDGNTYVYAANEDTFTYTPTIVGEYQATLIVTDNNGGTDADLISIYVEDDNHAPVAEAGNNQNVILGSGVMLNGSDSYDPDGDVITFLWTLTKPVNSSATIDSPESAELTFIPDVSGTYTVSLTVTDPDGLTHTDTVTILVDDVNLPPVALISNVNDVALDTLVQLDGSQSYDPENSSLNYSWTLNAPAGSTAILSDSTSTTPSFTADYEGNYSITLTVFDGELYSETVAVSLTAQVDNVAPVADAGDDITVQPNETAQLDASASYDENGDSLSYEWQFVSYPIGDYPELDNATSATPSFIPGMEGEYVLSVTVSDGITTTTDNVLVSAVTQSVTIWWMEGEQRVQFAWPYTGYGYHLSWYLEDDEEVTEEGPYNFTAIGRDYTIRVSAVDNNGVTTPYFRGIYDGLVIHAGETIEFSFGFYRTYGEYADLEYLISIEGVEDRTWYIHYERAFTN